MTTVVDSINLNNPVNAELNVANKINQKIRLFDLTNSNIICIYKYCLSHIFKI